MNGRTDKVSNKADVTINSFKIKIYLNFIALPTESQNKILKKQQSILNNRRENHKF